MEYPIRTWFAIVVSAVLLAGGCVSPYHTDRGALFGGATGAGLGALVGNASGQPGAGAAIGAGLGVLTGAAVGSEMDEMEARNRAMIEAKLGQQVRPGAVTVGQVLDMHRSGVNEELIANHIRIHGMAAPLQSQDLIVLQQQQVPLGIIKAMQEPPRQSVAQPIYAVPMAGPQPIIVEQYRYGWGPGWHHPCYPHGSRVQWGIGFSN